MDRLPSPWWHPDRHRDRQGWLHLRHLVLQGVRGWFLDHGFIEVEPGALQVSPGNEVHLEAFETSIVSPDRACQTLYLHTSPEFACKKLLAAGETRIFSLSKVYRNGEQSALHAPEFTMLEWYRAEAPYEDVMADCIALARLAGEIAGCDCFTWQNVSCPLTAPHKVTRVAEAFNARGYDLLATIGETGPDSAALRAQVQRFDPGLKRFDTWSALFNGVLVEIERGLGADALELLIEYPASESALARAFASDHRVAERFELFAAGLELANGFGELTDADLQRRRLEEQMEERAALYGSRYPLDEDFLNALRHMPPASGCALGFDRLVMLAAGARSIEDVIWTPLSV